MDIRGNVCKYQYNLGLLSYSNFWTPVVRVSCYLKNVKLGKNVRFYGKTYFYRRPDSCIEIGNSCGFRSLSNSNLIGINRNCAISTLAKGAEIGIGNNCGFSGTVIGAAERILIGSKVRCGANTLITDNDWHLDDPRSSKPKPIIIHDHVWIGEGAKILKGVQIGKNSIIGAGSVVTKSIPANAIAAGNPCLVIKPL